MMLSRVSLPKSKGELIRALQKAPFRSFDVFEGSSLPKFPRFSQIVREGDAIIVLRY